MNNKGNFVAEVLEVDGTPPCTSCDNETVLVEVQDCPGTNIKKGQKVHFCTYCETINI